MNIIEKLPKYLLWVLLLVGVCVAAAFFGMGSEGSLEVAGDYLDIPKGTNLFIGWNYALVAIALCATLCAALASFVGSFKADSKKAIKSLCVIVAFVLLFVLCWFLGSGDKVEILGYEGTDNQGFWAQLADMMMYAVYFLVGGTICAIIWGAIYSRIKK